MSRREEWLQVAAKAGLTRKFAKKQWRLYWRGARGVELHDATIFLIDKYGITSKRLSFLDWLTRMA
jgi:hypothetical protein